MKSPSFYKWKSLKKLSPSILYEKSVKKLKTEIAFNFTKETLLILFAFNFRWKIPLKCIQFSKNWTHLQFYWSNPSQINSEKSKVLRSYLANDEKFWGVVSSHLVIDD